VLELQKELRESSFDPFQFDGSTFKGKRAATTWHPNLKDRVVQMLLKMVLEPILESDFLNCSNGSPWTQNDGLHRTVR